VSDQKINGKTVTSQNVHKQISNFLWQYNPAEVWMLIEQNLINFEFPLEHELQFLKTQLDESEPKH
jgi:hypothetical protein